ncbi:dATP/dGTP pyrophosphohydrolase domain-containing protein [Pleomorphovibrio marinus]|uniref:dATP/dGTP pyrophosphohydrolase domain-containing protein n=1 Tax=Pleomorphovibrio marinus TaxID=2164132 RepID=UPI000E0A1062|nr:dATP/dGTP pyrophosphohydrolase domain-containing protein [Pleomorphovibrio marinus]
MAKELQELMDRNRKFAQRVFPLHCDDPKAPLHHLIKEVKETIDELEADNLDMEKVLFEYADCLILLVGSAVRIGITAEELIKYSMEKMTINEKRDWGKPDKNGVYSHKKNQNG